jgi:hypothetical protein
LLTVRSVNKIFPVSYDFAANLFHASELSCNVAHGHYPECDIVSSDKKAQGFCFIYKHRDNC